MKYLTPNQYRLFDDGLPDSTNASIYPDTLLQRYIQRAESMLDNYVGFALRQGGGFEPHTVSMFEQTFDYMSRRARYPAPPVPVRNVIRFRIQISNSSPSGEPLVATLLPTDCVINTADQYIEVVPLTAVTYAISPEIAQLGLSDPITQLDCEVGFYLPVWGETLTNPSGDQKTFQAQRGFWALTYDEALHLQPTTLPPTPPNIYANGILLASSAYTLNVTEGEVLFATAQTATITADYTYTIPDAVMSATISQVTYLLGQRTLNQMGLQGMEQVRNGDQQFRRHMRMAGGATSFDTETIAPEAQRLLAPYVAIPIV